MPPDYFNSGAFLCCVEDGAILRWKRFFVASLGGVLFGTVAMLGIRRKKKPESDPPEAIPDDIERIEIETDTRELTYRGEACVSWGVYKCIPTQFRVWKILDVPALGPKKSLSGQRIYHISPQIYFRPKLDRDRQEEISDENFYATLYLHSPLPQQALADYIARRRYVEFRKCHVGGSLNGVEAGGKLITTTTVASYRIILKIH